MKRIASSILALSVIGPLSACATMELTWEVPTSASSKNSCESLAKDLTGKSIDQANFILSPYSNFSLRKVQQDQQVFVGTKDYRPDRINVNIQEGVVVSAYCG